MGSNPSKSGLALDEPFDAPPSGMTRRSFLTAVNALALVAVLEACTGKHHPAAARASATGSASSSATSFPSSPAASAATADFLAVLRQAVQASPDFLQQAAAKAVASKDINTIAAFVRDRISVIPAWNQGDDSVWSKRWGSRVTLRGGAGTLRDRADLLVELLTAAGLSATVMQADLPSVIDLPTLYQVRATDFEPDAQLYDKAVALLPAGTELPTYPAASSSADSPAQAAAKALAAAIPTSVQSATIRKDLLPKSVPLVAVSMTPSGPSPSAASPSAAQQYVFALGDLTPTTAAPSGLTTVNAETPTPQVSVTISALTNPAPGSTTPHGEVVELVTGTWLAEEVFGRQVLLNFVPPSGAIGFLTGDPADQSVRVPLLHVQSELAAYAPPPIAASSPPASTTSFGTTASSTSSTAPQVFTGPPITLQGDVLSPPSGSSADATVAIGAYGPMTTLSASQQKAAIASVTTMKVTANASTFPEVELDVAVTDSAGNSVDGLDAAAFTITDNGTPASSIALMSNAASDNRPRILVIYDTTGSVAETWPSAAAKAAFEQSLATTLVSAAQQTPFDVQILGLNTAPSPDPTKWAAPDQATLLTSMSNAGGEYSVVWGALSGGGLDQGVVAALMVSDFQSNGETAADIATAQRRIAAAHIPIFCLTIGKPDATAVSTIIKLSGGTQIDPLASTTSSALAALIKPLVAARTQNTYRLRYTAPIGGSATHSVTLKLAGRSTPTGTATYTAPATPATPWSFAGLYVRISVGAYDSGVRHLAGINLDGSNYPIQALDDAAAATETRAAICGLTTIAFEPGTVSAAAILDDLIASAQSARPVLALTKTATPQDVINAASKNGVRRVPTVLASLFSPGLAKDSAAVPTMRVAILQERANALDGVDIRFDLPPRLNTIEPLGTDPVAAFGTALALSGTAAAAEAASFDASAFSSLAGRPLTFLPAGTRAPWDTFMNALPAAQQPAWEGVLNTTYYSSTQHALVPTGAPTGAFWVVDSTTGAATAVLLDGSGGALTDDACSAGEAWLAQFLNLAGAILTLVALICIANAPPTNAGIYYCLGKTASADFQIVNVIFAALSAGAAGAYGNWAGVSAALAGLAMAFVPFGAEVAPGASVEVVGLAGGEQVWKIGATLGLGYLGLTDCDYPAPAPPAPAAPPAPTDDGDTGGDTGGTYVQPVPVCPVDDSEGGTC
ncbi:MAG TPA: hypothetical protein VGL75_02195 [Acidothermaceae bacterium]